MSRAYLFYFLTFAAAIGGLWVILTVGAAMDAPDDLNGDWTLKWEGAAPAEMDASTMRISQSGRYFFIRFGSREPKSFTLTPVWQGARQGRLLRMELKGERWQMNLYGPIPIGESPRVTELKVLVLGPSEHSAVARRVGAEPASRPAGVAHAR